MTQQVDVAVLGGGISGLTAGFLLSRQGFRTVVMEKSGRPGGSITTWRQDGFLFELGPNTVLNNAPEIDMLCEQAEILKDHLIASPVSGKRFIVKRGRLVPLPANPPSFLKSNLFSWRAKARLVREPFIKPAPPDAEETIAAFVRRRLGEELLQYAVGPFVSGVYAGNPETLSTRYAVGKIYALEQKYGSLIKGSIARRKGPAPGGGLFSFPDGLEVLPQALASQLGDGFAHSTTATAVTPAAGGYQIVAEGPGGEDLSYTARSVICAVPAKPAGGILAPLGGEFPSLIPTLPYASIAMACMGFRRADIGHALDGFGFLAPEVEGRFVLGCLFSSSLFPGRAPDGEVALTAFAGGAVHPERVVDDEGALIQRVLDDIGPLLNIKGKPTLTKVVTWKPAIPQYVVGHGRIIEAANSLEEAHPGVFISGNLLHGVSVGACIQNAAAVAKRAAGFLSSSKQASLAK